MATIDNRVVSMTFDNKDFDRNIKDTMSMLDRLKSSLNFSGGAKSMADISAASKNFTLSEMSNSIAGVSAGFAALATVGITALANLTNKAVDAGLQFGKSLSIGPLISGFQEYEVNMNSIQTILANTQSKGTTLDDVNGALDELNTYADKTIYNFAEMAKNIGTFTAAGVDLDTSVKSIKGIANVAAVSGSNSMQASSAMYQLSQAIANGSLKLMDWNSVVNAGMGGEVLQQSLFETGKAMGTLANVPVDQTFAEWKDAGNSFRESLQDGWVTADVLTTALSTFTGELSTAELVAIGYSDAQIVAIQKMADTAVGAATEVKTATQLVSVVQEAIGSGWASTFRIVIGDFAEAKALMTEIGNAVTGSITRMTKSRNDMLTAWKNVGGRDILIEGFRNALEALGRIITPIKEAFREVFPKKTAVDLVNLTVSFRDFTEKLKIGAGTAGTIKSVFTGIFSVFSVGIAIVKGLFGVFGSLIGAVVRIGSAFSSLFASAGNATSSFATMLTSGGGIQKVFDAISNAVETASYIIAGFIAVSGPVFDKIGSMLSTAADKVGKFKDKLFGLFSKGEGDKNTKSANVFTTAIEKLKDALNSASSVGEKVGNAIAAVGAFFQSVGEKVLNAGRAIKEFFSDFITSIKNTFTPESFKPAVGALGVGFLGGITALLTHFARNGLKFDFGQAKLFDSLIETFDGLTDTLKAMQNNIKSDTLMKIAIAVGILAVSMIALALIDGKALAKSLAAIAVGLGVLSAGLFALTKIDVNGASTIALATSLILLAGAIAILAIAIKVFSTMSTDELVRGTLGVAAAIAVLILAAKGMEKATGSLIRAAFGMGILSVALLLFAGAILVYSKIDMGSLVKGLIAIAAAIGIFVLASVLIDEGSLAKLSGSFLIFAFALQGIAKVISSFAGMSWGDLAKGFLGLFVALELLAFYSNQFAKTDMLKSSIGLVLMSVALKVLISAIETLANLSIGQLLASLIGLAALLAIIVVATNAMSGSLAGAAAMIVISGALYVLSEVLEKIGKLGLGTIIVGLIGIAGVLAIIGIASYVLAPVIPLILALGIAMTVVGAGFALFGLGALLVASALAKLGEVGKDSVERLISVINMLLTALPGFAIKFAMGIVAFIDALLLAAPRLIESFTKLISALIDAGKTLVPKLGELVGVIIDTLVTLIGEKVPILIQLGIDLLMALLQGISDNIDKIVNTVTDIIEKFINAIADNISRVIEAGTNLIVALIDGLASARDRIIKAGADSMISFLEGIGQRVGDVLAAVGKLIDDIVAAIGGLAEDLADAGADALISFLESLGENVTEIGDNIEDLIDNVINTIADLAGGFADSGTDALMKFLDGLSENTKKIRPKIETFIHNLVWNILSFFNLLADAGLAIAVHILEGMISRTTYFIFYAAKLILTFLSKMREAARMFSEPIAHEGLMIGLEIIGGIARAFGLKGAIDFVRGAVEGLANRLPGWMRDVLGIRSPSRVFMEIGKQIPAGLAVGVDKDRTAEDSTIALANRIKTAFETALNNAAYEMSGMNEFNPTITPVLDLSRVKMEAKNIGGMLGEDAIAAKVSLSNANIISTETNKPTDVAPPASKSTAPTEIKFEQNNYSPEALTTSEIYKKTRGQIIMAKEELKIP